VRDTNARPFTGYRELAYTPVPDEFFDWQMQDLGLAETKVLLYIFRRTFGFKKHQDRIALSQFVDGICKETGERLDLGCGLSRPSVIKGIDGLVERGYISAVFACGRCGQEVSPEEMVRETRQRMVKDSETGSEKPVVYTVQIVPRVCPGCGAPLFGQEERWFSLVMQGQCQEEGQQAAAEGESKNFTRGSKASSHGGVNGVTTPESSSFTHKRQSSRDSQQETETTTCARAARAAAGELPSPEPASPSPDPAPPISTATPPTGTTPTTAPPTAAAPTAAKSTAVAPTTAPTAPGEGEEGDPPDDGRALFEELFGPATTEGPPPTPEGMTPEAFRHQQTAQALEAAYARQAEEPWLGWGSESRVVERYHRAGLEKTTILRLCWALERHFGLHPVWGNAGHEGFWMREAADLLEAAEGNVELVLDTARQMRADRLTISSPKSLFKKTVATMAERRSGIEGAGSPGSSGPGNGRPAAPGRAPMPHVPSPHAATHPAPASHTSAPQTTGPHAPDIRRLTPEEIQIRDMLAADAARARDSRARAPGPGPDDSPPGELKPEELQARTIYATEEA
jgi:hypothetical protein